MPGSTSVLRHAPLPRTTTTTTMFMRILRRHGEPSGCIWSRRCLFASMTRRNTPSSHLPAGARTEAVRTSLMTPLAGSPGKNKNRNPAPPARRSSRSNGNKIKLTTSRDNRRSAHESDSGMQTRVGIKDDQKNNGRTSALNNRPKKKKSDRISYKPKSKLAAAPARPKNSNISNGGGGGFGKRNKNKKKVPSKWDPYVLAEKTKKALDKGQITAALALARDGGDRATVSWNYIIQYEFQNKHVAAALRNFTEMRKRGAAPNDRTFTMVLNGLAINVDIAPTAVQKCLRIFAYITDQKKVKVNNFHLNTALKVCTAASDVDAMWQVLDMADNIVEPDDATYTTIAPLLAKEGISLEDVFAKDDNSETPQVGFIRINEDSPKNSPGDAIGRQSTSRRTYRHKDSRQSNRDMY
ncbi:hypothetical protein V1509DRAFT_618991 [Lipomyces kononenkoae]